MPTIRFTGATLQDPDRVIVPALNIWWRLEALPHTVDLEPALQAAIADPLWLLCRQWQFLEFAGEDAGTPVKVEVEGERATLSRYLAGAPGGDAATDADDYSSDSLPLEVVVEREPILARHPRLAAEAGLHLQRMLNDRQLSDEFIAAYPLRFGTGSNADGDPAGAEWLELARGRALDARELLAALAPLRNASGTLTALPPNPAVPASSEERILDILRRWLSWCEDVLIEGDSIDAWRPRPA